MIKLFNTLTRKKESFKSIIKNKASLYTCGPTVYWYAHLGNLRTYLFEDILRRTLEYNGYKIKQVMNITDIEDKIIKKALQENKDIYAITKPYIKLFFDDLKKLNIEKAEKYPKAASHIKEMINIIKSLIKKGLAYKGEDGSVYFDISKYKNYGKLSRLDKEELKINARISSDEYKKEEAQDFVLWKNQASEELKKIKAVWKSPWGWGRPGWHIECSAMAIKYLGKTFDIHCGAVDLIFPHHENEIAQSEGATGKKFSNYWLHGEHLLINGQKMSKSLGNFFTLRDIESAFNPLAFRYLVLTSHYRSKLNFTWESLQAAQNALFRLNDELQIMNYESLAKQNKLTANKNLIIDYQKKFLSAINDDLNTPKAIALIWRIIKDDNLPSPVKKQLILEFNKVLGLRLDKIKPIKIQKIPIKIKEMTEKREQLRRNQQFIPADLLRKKIEELGYVMEDTANGLKIKKSK
ncbi:MAG: cysteine--tRNA ligase [Patescibacteria group bacterium]